MGIVCSKLFCLFCCPPYLPSIVSKAAFSPPPCTYSIVHDSQYRLRFLINYNDYDIERAHEKYLACYIIRTKHHGNLSCIHLQTAPWTRNTILYSHGNAVDIGLIAGKLIELGLQLKVNIVAYDYCGYGTSSGRPSERNLYANIESVLEFIHKQFDIPHRNIILYGQSIGSVPTVFLAGKFRFAVAILHSPLASGFQYLNCGCCCLGLCRCCDVLNNLHNIKHIRCRVLIIHGLDDQVTPIEHSYELMKRIPNERLLDPLVIDGAGHNNIELFPVYLQRLQYLIDNELEFFQTQFSDSVYLGK